MSANDNDKPGRAEAPRTPDDEIAELEEISEEDLLAVLRLIAERAGKVLLGYYVEADEIEVRHKDDRSPVTEADEAAEALILGALNTMTPHIPVVSEEAAAAGEIPDVSGGRFWLVDPLDGTREFLDQNNEFTVNIALVEHGVPVAGVVHAPALAMTWAGARHGNEQSPEGGQATFSETDQPPMAIAARAMPPDGAVVIASRRHGDSEALAHYLGGVPVKERINAGSSLKFCLIASGKADLYPRFGTTMEWDTAAGHAVLRAAGGCVVEADSGEPLAYGKPDFRNPHFIARGKC